MQISDEKLWESCLTGDKEAFKEIYCRFYSLLYNYGSKLVSDKDLVKDCIQDIFIKLIQNYPSLSPTPNVKGYLSKPYVTSSVEHWKRKTDCDIHLVWRSIYNRRVIPFTLFRRFGSRWPCQTSHAGFFSAVLPSAGNYLFILCKWTEAWRNSGDNGYKLSIQ